MTCPVCKRELEPTLSICYACGAMVNDTVREELESKIERVSATRINVPRTDNTVLQSLKPSEPPISRSVEKNETTELHIKKTSPTLVGFQPRNATVPDWRLQLQNSVRQRKRINASATAPEMPRDNVSTVGATALKPKPSEKPENAEADPLLQQALRRIEESRKRFAPEQQSQTCAAPQRTFPFEVVSQNDTPDPSAPKATVNVPPKPRLIKPTELRRTGYDTNKLPRIEEATGAETAVIEPEVNKPQENSPNRIGSLSRLSDKITRSESSKFTAISVKQATEKTAEEIIPDLPSAVSESEVEYDDIPAISTRLLAGTFDILAVAFATGLLLLPAVYLNAGLFSLSGTLAAAAVFGIVYFAYCTFSIWYYGRTLGMQIFGLEIIDAEENEYPTLHQSAVYSAASLFTLLFLGLGFIPVFINQERRAAHDLIAGTVLVREL